MATKVFKRGGFIIVDQAGTEAPIPVNSFDYQIIGTTSVSMRDAAEGSSYNDTVTNIQNESGVAIGTATDVAAYFSTLVAQGNANSPTHRELTNPASVVFSNFKKLDFVCSGNIDVTLNGNTIQYPYNLTGDKILGESIEADSVSLNAVTFNGTGTVLITIKQEK